MKSAQLQSETIENVKASRKWKKANEDKMLYELAAPKDIIVKIRQETSHLYADFYGR